MDEFGERYSPERNAPYPGWTYRGDLVPSSIVLEIRTATVQLIQDTLGDAYIANLVNLGLTPEDARRGYDDLMLGLRAVYAEFVRKMRADENTT